MKRTSQTAGMKQKGNYKKKPYGNSLPRYIDLDMDPLGVVRDSKVNPAYEKFQSKSLKDGEIKTLDTIFTGAYNPTYTPDTIPCQRLNLHSSNASSHQCLNLMQQGPGVCQRIGNKVSLKSIRIRLQLEDIPANSVAESNRVRVVVYYDRNCNGAYYDFNTLYQDITNDNNITTGTMWSSISVSNMDRLLTIMDKIYVVPPSTAAGQATFEDPGITCQDAWTIDEYIKLKSLESVYKSTQNPGTIAMIQSGSLVVACYSDQIAANMPWALVGTCRLRYRDS